MICILYSDDVSSLLNIRKIPDLNISQDKKFIAFGDQNKIIYCHRLSDKSDK